MPQPLVLIQDPDTALARTLAWIVRENGFDVRAVGQDEDLLSAVIAYSPHAVVLSSASTSVRRDDEPFAILAKLRASAATRPVQFLLTSSGRQEELAIQALDLDADHVAKPFRVNAFLAVLRRAVRRAEALRRAATGPAPEWDIFISHASEDKDAVARPLATLLTAKGLRVWYDEFTLKIGDGLRRSIEKGIASSRFGVVILSPAFFAKEWPQRELDTLLTLELAGDKRVLPIWHRVTHADVALQSPLLADRLAIDCQRGLGAVVDEVLAVLGRD